MTLTVHELLIGMVPPVGVPKVSEVAPAAGAHVPPQVVAALGGSATCKPTGRVSVNATPFNGLEVFGLVRVNVSVEIPLIAIGSGEKIFVIVGGLSLGQPWIAILSRSRRASGLFDPAPSAPIRKVVVFVPVGTAAVVILVQLFLGATGTGVYGV